MFLFIQSDDPMNTSLLLLLLKMNIRPCSRYLSTIRLITIFSLMPLTPGIRQHILRTIRLIFTPALLASYNLLISTFSSRLLSLIVIDAGKPFFALAISLSIRSRNFFCRLNWDTSRCLNSISRFTCLFFCCDKNSKSIPSSFNIGAFDVSSIWSVYNFTVLSLRFPVASSPRCG